MKTTDTDANWASALLANTPMCDELREALSRAVLLRYSRHKLSIGHLNRISGYESLRRSMELKRATNKNYTAVSKEYVAAKQVRFKNFESDYLNAANMFQEAALVDYNLQNSERFQWRRVLQRRDSLLLKWLHDIVRTIDASAIPILFVGNGVFGNKHSEGSKPSMGSKHVREVLSRRFVCVLVAEQFTSAKCPSCKLNLVAGAGMRGRERQCTSSYCRNSHDFGATVTGKRRYSGHRDYLACENILLLALGSLFGLDRPASLQFLSDRQDNAESGAPALDDTGGGPTGGAKAGSVRVTDALLL